ncbi:MAG: RDD family protein [Planctomycetales bacterium]|nr:RDD family protein [Planctomycetales bacterium]
MAEDNPYTSPVGAADAATDAARAMERPAGPTPAVSTVGTLVPRTQAFTIDMLLVGVLGIVAAKSLPSENMLWPTLAAAAVVAVYFVACEALLGRTPGKFLTGLVVVGFDGSRCTWEQSLVRNAYRLIEANPVLLGALPAGLSIIFSQHHQRLGDRAAKTIVVPSQRWRRAMASA